jgi:hypothetical protein
MEPLYTLYLDFYATREDDILYATDRTDLERAAAVALAAYDRDVLKTEPRTFYQFGIAWDRLRNTAPVK